MVKCMVVNLCCRQMGKCSGYLCWGNASVLGGCDGGMSNGASVSRRLVHPLSGSTWPRLEHPCGKAPPPPGYGSSQPY